MYTHNSRLILGGIEVILKRSSYWSRGANVYATTYSSSIRKKTNLEDVILGNTWLNQK